MESNLNPAAIKAAIEKALPSLDVSEISVRSEGGTAILEGSVESPAARAEAERAAWKAEGVHKVENRLEVRGSSGDAASEDAVYEADLESFPASDAPAWTAGPHRFEGSERDTRGATKERSSKSRN